MQKLAVILGALWFGTSSVAVERGQAPEAPGEGIHFVCSPAEISRLKSEVPSYLINELGLPARAFRSVLGADGRTLSFVLTTPATDTDTLTLNKRPELGLSSELTVYVRPDGRVLQKEIVSRAEIAAALMQHGDQYVLTGNRCRLDALVEHIGVRQNIARWGTLAVQRWYFPEEWIVGKDGKMELISRYADFNPNFWESDSDQVKAPHSVYEAVADAFTGKYQYEVGCLSAAKLIFVMGIFDYYKNVAKNDVALAQLEARARRAPLTDIDAVHEREKPYALIREGKFLKRRFEIPGNHWIPGDWGYIKNPDEISSERPGYEGSNVTYLGQGIFNNYFGDRPNALHGSHLFYPSFGPLQLDDHLLEVFHWRHHILENWKHDPRRKFFTEEEVAQLRLDPRSGGLIRDVRDSWGDFL